MGGYNSDITLTRGAGWGLLGGVAGTTVMDLCLIGAFSAAGLPALECLSSIGDTVASFFAILGVQIAGGVPLGVATQYLIGPAIGASFGAGVARIYILRVNSWKRDTALAVLYVEMIGLPLLATMPILLKWTSLETVLWFGGGLIGHLIVGAVLGLVISYGLRPASGVEKLI